MSDSEAPNRIFCAIDSADFDAAQGLVRGLAGAVGGIKLGLEFFTANGITGVRRLVEDDAPGNAAVNGAAPRLFLDLKFHDIPNTVAAAVRAAMPCTPFMINVHAQGGAEMCRAAAAAAAEEAARLGVAPPSVLGVTVLTSLDDNDLAQLGQGEVADQVRRLAALCQDNGLDGVVCSAFEAATLRAQCGAGFTLVVPGIRPGVSAADDQKRVMGPGQAVKAGADYLVIGRPITRAPDPAAAARAIAEEITAAETG